jgi:hypothetical protein
MQTLPVIDCPQRLLGSLKPPSMEPESHGLRRDGSTVVNGVELPAHVLEELRLQGIAPGWYNSGQLQDAVIACAHDRKLIDDEHGTHFGDQLTLHPHEKNAGNALYEGSRHRGKSSPKPHHPLSRGWAQKETERRECNDHDREIISHPA